MGRPKASQEARDIAVAFAFAVSRPCQDHQITPVDVILCHGRRSVFGALSSCAPNIIRNSGDKARENRSGISIVELNKALVSTRAFVPTRCRKHSNVKGIKAARQWKGRRWLDDGDCYDLGHLNAALDNLQQKYPSACRSMTTERVLPILRAIRALDTLWVSPYLDTMGASSSSDNQRSPRTKRQRPDPCVAFQLRGGKRPHALANASAFASAADASVSILPGFWSELHPADRRGESHVITNVGFKLEQPPTPTPDGRARAALPALPPAALLVGCGAPPAVPDTAAAASEWSGARGGGLASSGHPAGPAANHHTSLGAFIKPERTEAGHAGSPAPGSLVVVSHGEVLPGGPGGRRAVLSVAPPPQREEEAAAPPLPPLKLWSADWVEAIFDMGCCDDDLQGIASSPAAAAADAACVAAAAAAPLWGRAPCAVEAHTA